MEHSKRFAQECGRPWEYHAGDIDKDANEFIYRIKATNAGNFTIPPAYGEGMYERTVKARSAGGVIVVEKK